MKQLKFKEWIMLIPDPNVREKIFKNTELNYSLDEELEGTHLGIIINEGFAWRNTSEGKEYWWRLYKLYSEIEFND